MALGEHVISRNEVLSHIEKLNETLIHRNLQKCISLSLQLSWHRKFQHVILNHYPSKIPWKQDKRYILQHYNHTDLAAGEITQELVEGILLTAAYKDAIILTTATNPETLHGHATTLKRSSNNSSHNFSHNANDWFLLDSHNDHPKELLTSRDWNSLQGSIIFLHKSSVWDGFHPESNLHLADSSFPFDPNTFTREDSIINIDTTPEPSQHLP
eukprot:1146551-Pelagomonas_calceolata.AAC.1